MTGTMKVRAFNADTVVGMADDGKKIKITKVDGDDPFVIAVRETSGGGSKVVSIPADVAHAIADFVNMHKSDGLLN